MAATPRRIRTVPLLPKRRADSHKGDFGRILLIGGSRGMVGAPSLAANAALRAGAGLVTVAVPACVQPAVASLTPCATSIALPCDREGRIRAATRELSEAVAVADVIGFGPGLGRGDRGVDARWARLLRECSSRPMVIDADGLNLLGRLPRADRCVPGARWVLTPHPGEAARLLGCDTREVQADRVAAALRLRRVIAPEGSCIECVVALKGAGTVVTDGRRVFVNGTGNPGMATGGSGDVLTGVAVALVGQGLSLFEAAVLATHVHGLAGDLAARQLGEVSLIATDLIAYLPRAFRAVFGRAGR